MSLAARFEIELEQGLKRLNEDEWAIVKIRELMIAQLLPSECFSSIPDVMELATRRNDIDGFVYCCLFTLDLARKANTSEFPSEAKSYLSKLEDLAQELGPEAQRELASVYSLFRLPTNSLYKRN